MYFRCKYIPHDKLFSVPECTCTVYYQRETCCYLGAVYREHTHAENVNSVELLKSLRPCELLEANIRSVCFDFQTTPHNFVCIYSFSSIREEVAE